MRLLSFLAAALVASSALTQSAAAKKDCSDKADELDPDKKSSWCANMDRGDLDAGVSCLAHPDELGVTQASFGAIVAECKREKLDAMDSDDRVSYLRKHQVPVVVAPKADDSRMYMVDHHHLSRAVLDSSVESSDGKYVYVCVDDKADKDLDMASFWNSVMRDRVWLKDAHGDSIDVSQLPASVAQLANDPFRTLGWYTRESHAWIKCGDDGTDVLPQCQHGEDPVLFMEFIWGNYLRKTLTFDQGAVYSSSLPTAVHALRDILPQAMSAALSPQAQSLPGYNTGTDTQAPQIVALSDIGCPTEPNW